MSVKVTNAGKTDATETVQFYIRQFVASLTPIGSRTQSVQSPRPEIGQSRQGRFTLASSDLAFHDASGKLVTEPSAFQLWLCSSAESRELTALFSLKR